MVCVNSVFSRKDNCETFSHAIAVYIGVEVAREMIWHIFCHSKTENVFNEEQTLTLAGNLYRIHNREFSGTTSD